jgi:DNA-binding CsgD family transcriptional regulator
MNRLNKNPDDLSELEIKVMIGTCNGLSCSEIGRLLYKPDRTIEKCRKNLYQKFYVKSKEEFIRVARKLFKLP